MPQHGMRDLHFLIAEGLFDEFNRMYPGKGEKKAILTKFVNEAIKLQSLKDDFITKVGINVKMRG